MNLYIPIHEEIKEGTLNPKIMDPAHLTLFVYPFFFRTREEAEAKCKARVPAGEEGYLVNRDYVACLSVDGDEPENIPFEGYVVTQTRYQPLKITLSTLALRLFSNADSYHFGEGEDSAFQFVRSCLHAEENGKEYKTTTGRMYTDGSNYYNVVDQNGNILISYQIHKVIPWTKRNDIFDIQ